MLAVASAPAPMPKARQNSRLFHNDAGLRGGRADRRVDPRPGLRRRRDRRHRLGEPAEALLPERHFGRKRRLLRKASFDLAPLLRAQHAQHVFGGDQVAAVGRTYGVVLAHASRQALSFNRPRLIQLFIVPSGTLMRSASSS